LFLFQRLDTVTSIHMLGENVVRVNLLLSDKLNWFYFNSQDLKSIKFKFICITLFTIHIALKQLYRKCISEMYIEK